MSHSIPIEMSPPVGGLSGEVPQPSKESVKVSEDQAATEKPASKEASDVEYDTAEKQYGVEKIRAITSAWSYRALVCTYIL
jgi:hypothetical protein